MPVLLILIFILGIEIFIFAEAGDEIGGAAVVILTFLTAMVGLHFVQSQGLASYKKAQEKMAKGESTGRPIFDGLCILFAGLLLLLPGFFTDTIGVLFLIPWFRGGLYKKLKNKSNMMFMQ